jgi:tRNA(fMet)-specific endonuclease VapC
VKYILDTNAVSALMRGDTSVVAALGGKDKQDVAVSQPVMAEIAYGIERLPRSHRKERLRERFGLIRGEIPRIPWDDDVSDRFGAAKAALERTGQRLEDFDVAVAAHALSTGAVLVTANVRHLARVPGLKIEDWGEER